MTDTPAEIEIEAFRAGAPAAVRAGITTDVLDEVVNAYQADSAPLVFGHPTSDQPAKGVISGLRRDGDSLFAKLKNVARDAVDGVRKGEWINRSMAFWSPEHPSNPTPGKWNARHLGLLGAASPGIPAMSKLQFSADDTVLEGSDPAPAVVFAAPTPVVVIQEEARVADEPKTPTKAEFDAQAAEVAELKQKLADREKQTRFDANSATIDRLKQAGKITPAQAPVFAAILNALPDAEFEFAADDKQPIGKKLVAMFDAAKPQVVFEAITPKDGPVQFDANDPAQLTAAANKLVDDGKAPTFAAAVIQLSSKEA